MMEQCSLEGDLLYASIIQGDQVFTGTINGPTKYRPYYSLRISKVEPLDPPVNLRKRLSGFVRAAFFRKAEMVIHQGDDVLLFKPNLAEISIRNDWRIYDYD